MGNLRAECGPPVPMIRPSLKEDAEKAVYLYNSAAPHIKAREQCRLLGILGKAVLDLLEEKEKDVK